MVDAGGDVAMGRSHGTWRQEWRHHPDELIGLTIHNTTRRKGVVMYGLFSIMSLAVVLGVLGFVVLVALWFMVV